MSVGSTLGALLISFGIVILLMGAWMDFLLFIQTFFGISLDGTSGTHMILEWQVYTFYGGITLFGWALAMIGKTLRSMYDRLDMGDIQKHVNRFH
jgi:hypothetical protein